METFSILFAVVFISALGYVIYTRIKAKKPSTTGSGGGSTKPPIRPN